MTSQQIIGRYEVLEELGQGAMGTVYRAKDPAMDRVVALKTIRTEILAGQQGGEFRERFYREARAAGALAHPGIVPVFDVGEHEGMPFLVMEFIKGRTLAEAARSSERLSLERACEITQQIAEALGYAHQKGVVHRDIKAANILLTSRESYGIERPKITDFGVAKLTSAQITTTGQLLGTPAFMPPEQFSGGAIDGRSDLFALGVILYWMATGDYPFAGENLMTVSYKVMHTEPIPPRKLNPAVSEVLDQLILKCLAKNPADRYQSGEELARELSALRMSGMGTTMRASAAVAGATRPTNVDPQATVVELPTAVMPRPQAVEEPPTARPATATAAGEKKQNVALVLAVAALVIVVLGGWYVLRRQGQGSGAVQTAAAPAAAPASVATLPAAAPAPVPAPPASAPPVANAAAPPSRPAAGTAANPPAARTAPAAIAAAPAVRSTGAAPRGPATVDFDPTTLNPDENARLRVDLQRIPPNVELALFMNGKLFIRRTAAEFEKNDDDMYLPPGVHEFRVRASNGPLLKISNIVSTDFQAKKRKTLRIELRFPPGLRGTSPTPQQIAEAAQVFVSLR